MTWGEFKRAVEAFGVNDDSEIAFIDVSGSEMIEIVRDSTTKTLEIYSF